MQTERLPGYSFEGAVAYHKGEFPPQRIDYRVLALPLSRASAVLAKYDALLRSLHNKDLLLAPLRRQEAVVSSRIEGTVATLDEVLKYEAERENAETASAPRNEVLEVFSYTRALAHAQRLMNEGLPISARLIKEIHSKLLFFGRGADKQPGQFKVDQNYVVDPLRKQVLFIPISPERLEDGIFAFEKLVNDDSVEPLIQTALAHVEFEALHPFKDGNGRVGRMLITLNLWSRGFINVPHFYVSSTIEAKRNEYIDRLRMVSAAGEWTQWCKFFLEIVELQSNENIAIAERISALYSEMKEVFRRTLKSQWTTTALDYIFAKPVFRGSAFALGAGIPRQTAARFAKILHGRQLLTIIEPSSGRRPALYAFEPLLQIVRA